MRAEGAVHVNVPRDIAGLSTELLTTVASPVVPAPLESLVAQAASPKSIEASGAAVPEPPATPAPILDAEKLVVYHLALELQAMCAALVPARQRVLQDQLERASLSVVCCIAEGAGRRSRREKRRYYTIARGSATECAGIIDVLRLRRLAPAQACAEARSHVIRVVQLLTKLDGALA